MHTGNVVIHRVHRHVSGTAGCLVDVGMKRDEHRPIMLNHAGFWMLLELYFTPRQPPGKHHSMPISRKAEVSDAQFMMFMQCSRWDINLIQFIYSSSSLTSFYRLFIFPQQRKLMGSSAQISSGCMPVRVWGAGSGGRFRKVLESSGVCWCRFPVCAGVVGSGGRFRKVPEGSGVCWCGFRRQLPEGSGGFRKVPESSGVCWCRFRRQVWESSGVCWCSFRRQVPEGSGGFRKVPESSGVCWCRFRRQLPEGSGGLRRVPVFRKVQESFGVVCCLATLTGAAMRLFLNFFWWWHCPYGQNHCGTRMRQCSQTWHKATAVGDTTKAYFCVFLGMVSVNLYSYLFPYALGNIVIHWNLANKNHELWLFDSHMRYKKIHNASWALRPSLRGWVAAHPAALNSRWGILIAFQYQTPKQWPNLGL